MEDISRESARESLIRGTNNKKHICETLRLIYDEVERLGLNPFTLADITELLVDAMVMAKKMQNRLAYYQKTYKDNTGNKGSDIVGLTGVRDRAKTRQKRYIGNHE